METVWLMFCIKKKKKDFKIPRVKEIYAKWSIFNVLESWKQYFYVIWERYAYLGIWINQWWGRDSRRWACVAGHTSVVGSGRGWEYGILFASGYGHTAMTTTRQPEPIRVAKNSEKLRTLRRYNSLLSHANSENDFGRLIFANRHRVVYIIVVCTCKPVYTVVVVLCAQEPSRVIYH